MNEIPEFGETVQRFRAFLREQGHPKTLVWVFRDDLWKINLSRVLLRELHGSGRVNLAEKVFLEGRTKGLVQSHRRGAVERCDGRYGVVTEVPERRNPGLESGAEAFSRPALAGRYSDVSSTLVASAGRSWIPPIPTD